MQYEAVIGLEVHAELQTNSKMFCGCPVVDATIAEPNTAVCPVCSGMPGVLPVVNQRAVEYALRVALALNCQVAHTSIFARKNYFYPDLPKGYQISQYEQPLAENGELIIDTAQGEKTISIRRVHMEEDTGKLTHVIPEQGEPYSLVDLNRSGVSLLEIVSEPDLSTPEEVTAYASSLRDIVRTLGVNSGDMEKGVIRFEANVSIRPVGSKELGTRVEIKNLNTFRGMERAIRYEFQRQAALLDARQPVIQETLGWDETAGVTYSQRGKEEAHDYRYFPEPDLPPLVVEQTWIDQIKALLPELPRARFQRLQRQYGLPVDDARLLSVDQETIHFFEHCARINPEISPKIIANWICGQLFAWFNNSCESISTMKIQAEDLMDLLKFVQSASINQNTAKTVLETMLKEGKKPSQIITEQGLEQVSDQDMISDLVSKVLAEHPLEVEAYLNGKETLENWFFGQAMRAAKGKANPSIIKGVLNEQLEKLK
ncbi:MAG: Asp-tRNA(Asn)/Glu-tRNA(Gln) amidotransferase GatCAB subunit B [Chloroflexi bacterium HGW-Chloroflexi-3]|nr:MAG: Asp-tRNA(Asn)/Glu-tRNA(Gln) amidotransferase GatCAB subunit B [Chloroflexi bacterium HGW-Chloroflexi-3]